MSLALRGAIAIIDSNVAQLLVRNLDDALVQALKLRAARHGKSVEAEHREILRTALTEAEPQSFKQLLATIPRVGPDDAFDVPRDLPRDVD